MFKVFLLFVLVAVAWADHHDEAERWLRMGCECALSSQCPEGQECRCPLEYRAFFNEANGSDEHGDGTAARPWQTIEKVIAESGDTEFDLVVDGHEAILRHGWKKVRASVEHPCRNGQCVASLIMRTAECRPGECGFPEAVPAVLKCPKEGCDEHPTTTTLPYKCVSEGCKNEPHNTVPA